MLANLIFKLTMQQSTLKELSETLGLSISTVSRALKDHPDISDSTKKRVKDLASLMEYEPNAYAIQLRTRQSNVLGILLPSIDNFFYDSFIAAVEQEARLNGYSVLIMQSKDIAAVEQECLKLFRKNMIKGLFAALSIETTNLHPFQRLEEMGIPVIFFDRVPEISGYKKSCLADEAAARLAAEAIIAKNKKNVLAFFGHPHLSICKLRYASFIKTFKELSPKTTVNIAWPEQIEASKIEALKALGKKNRPDVIFCMGDMILIGVMYAIHELKLRVPEDIGVIGISNGFIPTMYNPKITYVETSGFKLGKLAANQMFACLNKKNSAEEVFLDSIFVEGGSL
ncbi:MAG: LacI family DNA-binding transcriptional regulator [Sphingobacteriales bacterium]